MLATTKQLVREANRYMIEVNRWLETGILPNINPMTKSVSIKPPLSSRLDDRTLLSKAVAVAGEKRIAPQVIAAGEMYINRGVPIPETIRRVLTDATGHASRAWTGSEDRHEIIDHCVRQAGKGFLSPIEVSEIRQLLQRNVPFPSYLLEKLNRQ